MRFRAAAVVLVLCGLLALPAAASNDTIRARAQIGWAEFKRDQAKVAEVGQKVRAGDRTAAHDLIKAASVLQADMRVAQASVFAELPNSPRGRSGRSVLIQGFNALALHAGLEMQYARLVIDHQPAGWREAVSGDSAARLAEGTRLVTRGLQLLS